uniref:RNA-dependent RNA polymerase n=1 Tax=Hymenolepis diminuta TaxID=6216 RepID=A0A0R3SNZ6_HYMDI
LRSLFQPLISLVRTSSMTPQNIKIVHLRLRMLKLT